MQLSGAGLFPMVVLALLAGLTFWLQRATEETSVASSDPSHKPEYFVNGLRYRYYDQNGDLRQTLYASRMQQYRDDQTTEVMEPKVVYVSDGVVVATANKGYLDKEGKRVQLVDDVRVVHAAATGAETVITTSELEAYPDDKRLLTKAAVRIAQGASTVTGVGLDSSGKTRVTVLGGRVHGVLESRR
jgi:lipopolysaccharide export system protein LptC